MNPYERGLEEGGGALDFLARNIWLLVPIQGTIKEFFQDYGDFPHQEGPPCMRVASGTDF